MYTKGIVKIRNSLASSSLDRLLLWQVDGEAADGVETKTDLLSFSLDEKLLEMAPISPGFFFGSKKKIAKTHHNYLNKTIILYLKNSANGFIKTIACC